MSGFAHPGRSARRPLIQRTSAAVRSAAPSSAPSATAVPPSGPVTNAGSTGQTISLAKSLKSDTAERPLTGPGSRDVGRSAGAPSKSVLPGPDAGSGIEPQPPADERHRKPAVRGHLGVEFRRGERPAARGADVVPQAAQLAAAQDRGAPAD